MSAREELAALGFAVLETCDAPPAIMPAGRRRSGQFLAYDAARELWAPHPDGDSDLDRLAMRAAAASRLAGPMTYAEALATLEANGFTLGRFLWGSIANLTWRLEHRASGWQAEAFTYLAPTVRMAAGRLLHIGGQPQASFADLLRSVELRTFTPGPAAHAARRAARSAKSCRVGDVDEDTARAAAKGDRERQSSLW